MLVGYWMGREFWGRGLATEALAELVAIGVLDRDHQLVGVVGLVPGDVDAEADVEGPLGGKLGQAQDVPAAAGQIQLAVDGLAVVAEEQEADVHSAPE